MAQLPPADFTEIEIFRFDSGMYDNLTNSVADEYSEIVEILKAHQSRKISLEEKNKLLELYRNHDVRNDLRKYFYRPEWAQNNYLRISGSRDSISYHFAAGYYWNRPDEVKSNSKNITLNGGIGYKYMEKADI
jgi:hypothetical protein